MSGVCSAPNASKHGCVSFAEASKHVGTAQCVSGTVLHVAEGTNGVTFLTFCQDHKTCPFTVVEDPGEPQSRAALTIHARHTNPLRNSSSGYLVPRHTMPSFQSV
jgi:hypothetical protein